MLKCSGLRFPDSLSLRGYVEGLSIVYNNTKRTRVTQRGRFYKERGMTEGAYREKRNNKITLACHCVRTSFLTLFISIHPPLISLFFLLFNLFLSYPYNVPLSWLCFITFSLFTFSVATVLPSFSSYLYFLYPCLSLHSYISVSFSFFETLSLSFSSLFSPGYPLPLRLHIFRATLSLWCVNQRAVVDGTNVIDDTSTILHTCIFSINESAILTKHHRTSPIHPTSSPAYIRQPET